MRILVVGSGGREHALAWKLDQSSHVKKIFCAPGNAATALSWQNVPIASTDIMKLLLFAQEQQIDLTVVGSDDPLAAGIVDLFTQAGLRIFGPHAATARLESSKSFAKEFMQRYGIPTGEAPAFTEAQAAYHYLKKATYPLVIKADGLALGKGVVIAHTQKEAIEAVKNAMERQIFGAAGKTILIEEFLQGTECSLHALVDKEHYQIFPDVKDHKRAFDGDLGPNTGGMGGVTPSGVINESLQEQIHQEILEPFLYGIEQEDLPFHGMLFPGLMLTVDGPKVLEFNCRFGDPETQVLMPRLKSDLVELLEATIDGNLHRCTPEWDERYAVGVVLASAGYPGAIQKGKLISGLEFAQEDPDVTIFHAGTAHKEGSIVTNGGRVLTVTALGNSLEKARQKAYKAAEKINFEGKQLRSDIGLSH